MDQSQGIGDWDEGQKTILAAVVKLLSFTKQRIQGQVENNASQKNKDELEPTWQESH